MSHHILKVVAPYFEALVDGSKTFEIRRNDRGFQRGDTVTLWEYEGSGPRTCDRFPCQSCKPRFVTATVGFVYSGDPRHAMKDALSPGHVVLSLLDVQAVLA